MAGLFFLGPNSKDRDPWTFPATEHRMKCSIRIPVFQTVWPWS